MLLLLKDHDMNYSSLWEKFTKICSIPRCSGNEEGIRNYIIEFAETLKLKYKTDEIGNIVVYKPATEGFEDKEAVILQAHMDMVCEKNSSCKHNFSKDPIITIAEDGWIKADGTTLGADNGIGVAMIMEVLSSTTIQHGPVEALFTVDEERGLTGAFNIEPDFFAGKKLINLDSEEDNKIYAGCAGGCTSEFVFDLNKKNISGECVAMNFFIKGFTGGHSGCDIHLGRGNSIVAGMQLMKELHDVSHFYIYDLSGGAKSNAIPREFSFELYFEKKDFLTYEKRIEKIVTRFKKRLKRVYRKTDPDFDLIYNIIEKDIPDGISVVDKISTAKIIRTSLHIPNGPISWIKELKIVETSSNFASINLENNSVYMVASQRSSDRKKLDKLVKKTSNYIKRHGGKSIVHSNYPGWKPDFNSQLLNTAATIYKKLFLIKPERTVIHAGLECGVIGSRISGLDMISIGPEMKDVHTPDEKLSIKSTEKIFFFLTKILENL